MTDKPNKDQEIPIKDLIKSETTAQFVDDYFDYGGDSINNAGSENDDKQSIDYGEKNNLSKELMLEINLPSQQIRRVNENFVIECTLHGSDKIFPVWEKLGDETLSLNTNTQISRQNQSIFATSKLIFKSLLRKDDGNYTCYSKENPNEKQYLYLRVKSE